LLEVDRVDTLLGRW